MGARLFILWFLLLGNLSFAQTDSLNEKKAVLADKMPTYPGGEEALMKYISSNLKYPETETKTGKEGIIYASFTVNKNGKVENPKILRTIGENFEKEAIRVISAMPDWMPGESNGVPVDVEFVLPIKFSLTVKEDKRKEN